MLYVYIYYFLLYLYYHILVNKALCDIMKSLIVCALERLVDCVFVYLSKWGERRENVTNTQSAVRTLIAFRCSSGRLQQQRVADAEVYRDGKWCGNQLQSRQSALPWPTEVHIITRRSAITAVMASAMPQPLNVSNRRRLAAHESSGNGTNPKRRNLLRHTHFACRLEQVNRVQDVTEKLRSDYSIWK